MLSTPRTTSIRETGVNALLDLHDVVTGHDWRIMAVAVAACAVSLAAAVFVYSTTPREPGWRRRFWLGLAGLAAGSGVWATHFIAMLAHRAQLPARFALWPTLGSLVVVVAGITLGLALGATPRRGRWSAASAAGGALVGLTIGAMHYLGMCGFQPTGHLVWDVGGVAASLGLAAGFAAVAVTVAGPGADLGQRVSAVGLLLLAVLGLHFTGMEALSVAPDPSMVAPQSGLPRRALGVLTVATAGLVFVVAVAAALLEGASRRAGARRLRQALDAMGHGVAVYDASDRLTAWNARYAELFEGVGVTLTMGVPFIELLEQTMAADAVRERMADQQAWLAERLAIRRGGQDTVFQAVSGRWVHVSDRRTPDGGVVSTCTDVTALKSAETAMAAARDRAESLAALADHAQALARIGYWRGNLAAGEYEWSPGFIHIYGLPPGAQMDLATIGAMIHPDDTERGSAFFQRRLTGEGADEVAVVRIVQPTGEIRHLHCKVDVERGPDGQPTTAFGTVVDVTEARLAEMALAESEARFRNLADNAPEIIAEYGVDRRLTYISPACEAVTGYTPEELKGEKLLVSLINPDDLAALGRMCEAAIESQGAARPRPMEFRFRHKSGEELWLESSLNYVVDSATDRHIGFIDVVRDVTRRKQLEAELMAARAEAEDAAAAKADFLANMTHELRTPLTSIIGFTNMTAQEEELSLRARHNVERIADASKALLRTVNDILDFSKLEAGQVAITQQPVELGPLAHGTLDLFAPQAGAKGLELVLDIDQPEAVVSVDPDRVRQILLNLVGNAVKFTASGAVTLRARHDGQTLAVEVVDAGAGIPSEKLQQLFKRFSQVDGSLARTQGGTGLGLAICKGLVEAMGGQIGVDSREGEGSRFWFRIPAAPAIAAGGADAPAAAPRATLNGVRALVVDDHPANRELASLFLEGAGVAVVEAEDGEAAVVLASEQPFDVILMDMRMPRLDGPGALQRIRAVPGPNRATPALAFTADLTADLAAELRRLGFSGGVAKPLDATALLEAVADAAAGATSETSDSAAA